MEQKPKKIAYICDDILLSTLDSHPQEELSGRASMVHSLIESYGLLKLMALTPSEIASKEDLLAFHSSAYIDFLARAEISKDLEKLEEEGEEFGLAYDCELFPSLLYFCRVIAGASLTAASLLVDGTADVCINWCGGWHHAQREQAAGFCYVNDIVLAIHRLLENFQRVLYIDLDVHHGDGVEAAFGRTQRVLTLSLHKHVAGFFPGSGGLSSGQEGGVSTRHAINVPLQDGLRDFTLAHIFQRVSERALAVFRPSAVVLQCGADGLALDPLGGFNLTPPGLARCLQRVLQWDLPTLLLGGGGYVKVNAARCWTTLTASALGKQLGPDIPDSCLDFLSFGPGYGLDVAASNQPDLNTDVDVKCLLAALDDKMEELVGEVGAC